MRVTLRALITPEKSKAKKSLHLCRLLFMSLSGSATWTRTRDPMINSHLLAVRRNGATQERGGDLGFLHSVSRISAARHEN